MPRWKKTSSEKIAEVVTEKLKKPDSSLKDLSKKTGLNKQTVSDILKKELRKVLTSSDYSKKLIEENIQIINFSSRIVRTKLAMLTDNIDAIAFLTSQDIKALSSIADTSFKQNQLLTGNSTENNEIKIKIVE